MSEKKPIVITKETLVPISLVTLIVTVALWVKGLDWKIEATSALATTHTQEIKDQGKEIDNVKTDFLKTVNEINQRLARMEGVSEAEHGKKESHRKGN